MGLASSIDFLNVMRISIKFDEMDVTIFQKVIRKCKSSHLNVIKGGDFHKYTSSKINPSTIYFQKIQTQHHFDHLTPLCHHDARLEFSSVNFNRNNVDS